MVQSTRWVLPLHFGYKGQTILVAINDVVEDGCIRSSGTIHKIYSAKSNQELGLYVNGVGSILKIANFLNRNIAGIFVEMNIDTYNNLARGCSAHGITIRTFSAESGWQ